MNMTYREFLSQLSKMSDEQLGKRVNVYEDEPCELCSFEGLQKLADKHNLGRIHWDEKIPLNSTSGKPMTVGYVFKDKQRVLFCKRSFHEQEFRLYNEFEGLS